MSDLTRDEIRAACEAVGWEWEFCSKCWLDSSGTYRFPPELEEDRGWMDAIALLEATGEDWAINRDRRTGEFGIEIGPSEFVFERDIPTAAVRAVNRAAEQPPQDKEATGE